MRLKIDDFSLQVLEMVASVAPEVFTDWKRPSAELHIARLFQVKSEDSSAGNNFSLLTGHMSFQIFLLVGHFTNWTAHNLLTDNTLKITQDVLVRCWSDNVR